MPVKCEYKEQPLSENFIRAVRFFGKCLHQNGRTNVNRALKEWNLEIKALMYALLKESNNLLQYRTCPWRWYKMTFDFSSIYLYIRASQVYISSLIETAHWARSQINLEILGRNQKPANLNKEGGLTKLKLKLGESKESYLNWSRDSRKG